MTKLCTAQTMMINKMPSSIIEKAQSSMEPKAMGVKMMRKIRISLMRELIIAQSLKLKAESKTPKLKKLNAEG